jgi:hypothetical protein
MIPPVKASETTLDEPLRLVLCFMELTQEKVNENHRRQTLVASSTPIA